MLDSSQAAWENNSVALAQQKYNRWELEYKVGNSSHTFPFSWTIGKEEVWGERRGEKAHFGIQPDISFVFLLIA